MRGLMGDGPGQRGGRRQPYCTAGYATGATGFGFAMQLTFASSENSFHSFSAVLTLIVSSVASLSIR